MSTFPRVIPVLLISDGYLVKPVRFKGGTYIGDPINAVRIFNEKQVDEILVCDIDATPLGTGINYDLIAELASEAFMPLGYGGGVTSVDEARRIVGIGVEKVLLNSVTMSRPETITEVSNALGASSTVVSVDAKRRLGRGWETFTKRGKERMGLTPVEAAVRAEQLGAGEVLLSSIDREGTFSGYDLDLIAGVSGAVSLPVIALGGASSYADLRPALSAGASAVAAGSMFVMNGKHHAVLISYPTPPQIQALSEGDSGAAAHR